MALDLMLPGRLAATAEELERGARALRAFATNAHRRLPAPAELRPVTDAMSTAVRNLRALAYPTATGCGQHPNGPVDPDPSPGQAPCLWCNDRARREQIARRGPAPRPVRGNQP